MYIPIVKLITKSGKINKMCKSFDCFIKCLKTIRRYKIEWKIFDDVSPDNIKHFKQSISGLILGLVSSLGLFLILAYSFGKDLESVTFFIMGFMIFAVMGVSFFPDIRCIVCLMWPALASNRVRWLILLYVTMITLSGPGINLVQNVSSFYTSINCAVDQTHQNAQIAKAVAKSPLKIYQQSVKKILNDMGDVFKRIKRTLSSILKTQSGTTVTINNQINYFNTLSKACDSELSIKNLCYTIFNGLYLNCVQTYVGALGDMMCLAIRAITGYTCEKVRISNQMCRKAKEKMKTMTTKANLNLMKNNSESSEAILSILGKHPDPHVAFNETQSRINVSDNQIFLKQEMKREFENLEQKFDIFRDIIDVVSLVWCMLTFTFLILTAVLFWRKWLKKDSFENFYVTKPLLKQEKYSSNMSNLLPLKKHERRKYAFLYSIRWTKSERKHFLASSVSMITTSLGITTVFLLDWGAYRFFESLNPIYDLKNTETIGPQLQLSSDRKSAFSQMLVNIGKLFNAVQKVSLHSGLSSCRPNMTEPDSLLAVIVGVVLLSNLLFYCLQVYILRLRHLIMIKFYPERAAQRAAYLRCLIKSNRWSFPKLCRSFGKSDYKTSKLRLSLIGRLIRISPVLKRLFEFMGVERVFCIHCGEEFDPNKEIDCAINCSICANCESLFCNECKEILNNQCFVCHNTIKMDGERIQLEEQLSDSDIY